MAKNKATIYKISTTNTYSKKDNSLEFCVGIFVYAMVLMIASGLFEAFYVENLFYAIVASLILSLLNTATKNAAKKPSILKVLPIKKSQNFKIITFTIGYAIPKVKIFNGKVNTINKGLIVVFNKLKIREATIA